jgi:hypothetical protein
VKYFLVMLKYHCNPANPEAMALLHKISGGLWPPNGWWKNHNLRLGSSQHCVVVLAS